MANAYTWVIEAMNCVPQEDGQTDVVITVHWRLNGTDGTNTATVYGSVGLTYTQGSSFTPYADLTQGQVIAWTQDALGDEQVASLEANVAAQLANLVNPPVVSPPLPWAA